MAHATLGYVNATYCRTCY